MKRILGFQLVQAYDIIQNEDHERVGYKRLIRVGKTQNLDDKYVYIMSQREMFDYFPNAFKGNVGAYDKTFNMISYAPQIFNIMVSQDNDNLDIEQSLDLFNNEN